MGVFYIHRNVEQAQKYYEKALASDTKTFGEEHPIVAASWNNLGGAWESKGEYDKAIKYYEKALDMFIMKLGKNHPSTKIV